MNRHELPDEDSASDNSKDASAETVRAVEVKLNTAKTVEVKVIAATVVALLASVAYAVLNAVAAQPDVLAPWPPALRFVTLAAIPPVLTFVAGYAIPSNRI